MRLIDADALKLTHCLECVGYDEDNAVCAVSYCDIGGVIHLEEAPTIDAVPVIRCRECIRWRRSKSDTTAMVCDWDGYERTENDYCSWAKRKDNE